MTIEEKNNKAEDIIMDHNITLDQKLFVLSQLYKDELSVNFDPLYRIYLAWKDYHLEELRSSEVIDYLESVKEWLKR